MMRNRRQVLAGGAFMSAAACTSDELTTRSPNPQTFVLIQGTWHGGWVWKYVRNILEDQGHRVFTPTLTGCGEREHLSFPNIGLETHIQDIVNVIEFEGLNDIFISAHSFSGIAMTGAVDRLRNRIKHVNFFDALVPREGRSSGVPRKPDGSFEEYFLERQASFIDGYKMDMWADYPLKMLLPEDHPKAEWVRSKITTHPAKAWTDELSLKQGGWDGLPRSFIHCTGQEFAMSSDKMIGPARGSGWQFIELDVPRNGMVTHPQLIADMFVKLATTKV